MISRQELIFRLSSPLVEEDLTPAALDKRHYATTPASVLIPILDASEDPNLPDWHLLFTHRTDQVADHKSQVSFPGGRADPHDPDPEATALREAYEEIGLKPQDVQVIGRLAQLPTITRYLVTPVIGLIPWPYEFTLQSEEVSRVFTIPLGWLADPGNHMVRQIENSTSSEGKLAFFREVIFFKAYQSETLWGVSAEITVRLIHKLSG